MKGSNTTITLKGARGKDIEIYLSDESPEKIEFILKSNRGNVKDKFTFETTKVIDALNNIKIFYPVFKERNEG